VTVDFPYRGYEAIAPAEIPDANVLGVYVPRTLVGGDEEDVLRRGIAEPIGAPRLRDAVRRGDRVIILVDDATRGTPVGLVLAHVATELEAAGVPDERIALLTAQGTHRQMTEFELRGKLGSFCDRFLVHQHDWLDESALHEFGRTTDGTRVTANQLLAQANFILGIGSIAPHRIKGFSGGAKIAFPGVAGREIQERNQWEAARHRSEDVMGIAENPMRLRIEEAARLVGLRYIVNCVSDGAGRVAGCFAGDVVLAHREGCRLSREINEVMLPARAAIVLADTHPADRDVWQSAKGVYSGTMAVRDGGTLIIVSPNPEGVAENHPVMLELGYRPFPELARLVEHRDVDDVVGISVLADLAQVMDRTECILVSPGVTRDQAERIGFRSARTVQDALDLARNRQGRDVPIAVLRRGGHVLPRVAGERYGA
jgi:nickel-dependent lactate racemase